MASMVAYDDATARYEIEAKLAALLDSLSHGRQASRFCTTNADKEFTKLIMDDLRKQISNLRGQLKAVSTLPQQSKSG